MKMPGIIQSLEHVNRLKAAMVFDVTRKTEDPFEGIPSIRRPQGGLPYWILPSIGDRYDFFIGYEMGLAYLRKALANQGTFDHLGLSSFRTIGHMLSVEGTNTEQREGFFFIVGSFLDYALNPHLNLEAFIFRLLALDDATLRRRCLAILDGENPPNLFAPEGLGWPE